MSCKKQIEIRKKIRHKGEITWQLDNLLMVMYNLLRDESINEKKDFDY